MDRKRANIDLKDVAKHISAFANAEGGILVIGVEDNGEITGFKYPQSKFLEKYIEAPFDLLDRIPKYKIEN